MRATVSNPTSPMFTFLTMAFFGRERIGSSRSTFAMTHDAHALFTSESTSRTLVTTRNADEGAWYTMRHDLMEKTLSLGTLGHRTTTTSVHALAA